MYLLRKRKETCLPRIGARRRGSRTASPDGTRLSASPSSCVFYRLSLECALSKSVQMCQNNQLFLSIANSGAKPVFSSAWRLPLVAMMRPFFFDSYICLHTLACDRLMSHALGDPFMRLGLPWLDSPMISDWIDAVLRVMVAAAKSIQHTRT